MAGEPDPSLLPFPALYARMRAGDAAAWSEFHARYEPLLRRMARRWLNPELRRQADSADMTQSVLRALLQSDGRVAFEDEGRLRAWLATVMRNRVVRLARRAKGPGGAEIGDLDPDEPPAGGAPGPADLAEKAEAVHRLKAALDLLARDEREIVFLREFEDLSFGDVAKRTGRPSADAARKAFDRARKRLEDLLRDGSGAGDEGKGPR
jgi:RNA polymerase sigma-70 factor (ECF subfamily)